jgi:hypothetical protein
MPTIPAYKRAKLLELFGAERVAALEEAAKGQSMPKRLSWFRDEPAKATKADRGSVVDAVAKAISDATNKNADGGKTAIERFMDDFVVPDRR